MDDAERKMLERLEQTEVDVDLIGEEGLELEFEEIVDEMESYCTILHPGANPTRKIIVLHALRTYLRAMKAAYAGQQVVETIEQEVKEESEGSDTIH